MPAALGGPPIRSPGSAAPRTLAEQLALPRGAVSRRSDAAAVAAAWSASLGGMPVVLAASPWLARIALMDAVGVGAGDVVELPANSTQELLEAIRKVGARPRFRPLLTDLGASPGGAHFGWSQPLGGVGRPTPGSWVDSSDSLPDLSAGWSCHRANASEGTPAAVFGLHLSDDPARAGALIVCDTPELAARCRTLLGDKITIDCGAALAQHARLLALSTRQSAVLAMLRQGLAEAAGLPLAAVPDVGALAHGVAVRIPEEADPATFLTYIRAENAVGWLLPELRPVHYAAFRADDLPIARATAAELSRWLLVPAGPGDTPMDVAQAVLGVVKAAEFLGVRWRTDPARATAYADELTTRYGPDHDAYRPVFAA